ncbi:recombinase family protein [Pseudonocardia alni]|uniref:recombinase family protein n=1 Tax=Pseudonocardia alni TaxID=33907 RepID=UPI00280BBAC3|nr:recombinase family protein [Pseudonocardia alni]
MRALILIRLSRVTDVTTSPERQRQACERYCQERGWPVVGIAEDLDTSGALDPLKRVGAGPWLRDRLDEFDVIVAWKLDRVGRNARDMSSLVNFLTDHGKTLATVQDAIDIATPVGRMLVYILATLAEMELTSISDRNTASSRYLIRSGRWRGGVLPAGYRSEQNPEGSGLVLVPDEQGTAPTVREIAARVLAGERLAGIVRDLNARGIQTVKDRADVLAGREPRGRQWTISNVRRMLLSPTLLGRIESDGQVLYGEDGQPVQRAEPLISEADHRAVVVVLNERKEAEPKQRRAAEPALLLHVLYCGKCNRPMYRLKGGPGRQPRYRCSSVQTGGSCGSLSPTQAEADELLTAAVVGTLGVLPFAVKQSVPGTDAAREIAELDARLASLSEAVPRFPAGSPALAGLLDQVDALTARRAELAAQPVQESGHRWVTTGETFAERWKSMTQAERNDWLRSMGVRATYERYGPGEGTWTVDLNEVPRMIAAVNPEFVQGFGDIERDDQAFQRMTFALNPTLETLPPGKIVTSADRRRLRVVSD